MQLNTAQNWTISEHKKAQYAQYGKAILMVAGVVLLSIIFMNGAEASTSGGGGGSDPFASTATQFSGWIQGNLGKSIAILGLIVGSLIAAVKKDLSAMLIPAGIGIGIGIIIGIINASFTAII